MNQTPQYQEGLQYSEEVWNSVLFGYLYRKEANRKESLSGQIHSHFRLGVDSDVLLWMADLIICGITWDALKAISKNLYHSLTKNRQPLEKTLSSVMSDEEELKEFYKDVQEFNDHSMTVTEEQFKYIRDEIVADFVGKETSKIFIQEKRLPTTQEYMEINKRAAIYADNLLRMH